jgi:hypothetical protein
MRTYSKVLVGMFLGMISIPLLGDSTFQVRIMNRRDIRPGVGQCDIRVVVDNEANVSLTGDTVSMRTIQGRESRDAGSECNAPLPRGTVDGFRFQVIDGRGQVALLSQPSFRSGGAIVRIRDSDSGESRYHFRISWNEPGYTTDRDYRQNDGRYGNDRGNRNDNAGRYGNGPDRGWDRGRGYEQGLRLGPDEAMSMCSDAVRNDIARSYGFGYGSVDIANRRFDNRQGPWNDIISGSAVARGWLFSQDFAFNCHLDLNRGTVDHVNVWRR